MDFECRPPHSVFVADPNGGHPIFWIDVRHGVIAEEAAGAP
jgi:hypothetical protein